METRFLFGLLLGIVGALLLNVGKGVQKQRVQVLTKGRAMFSPEHRKDLGVWLLGLGMTASSAVPYSLGLMLSESPSVIAAMTGVGLAGLAVFASRVLGEKMGRTDLIGIGLVVLGTSLLGYFGAQQKPSVRIFTDLMLIKTGGGLVLAAAVPCLASLVWRRIHGVAFGLAAGACIGLALFLADVALVRGGSFFGQFFTPYPYAAYGLSGVALVVTQIGFLRGKALTVVPAVNTATVLVPVVLQGVIYRALPEPHLLGLIALVVAGVVLLSTGAATRATVEEKAGK